MGQRKRESAERINDMNKSVILNCKNFKCRYNNKGDCKLSHISLDSDGSLILSKLICEDAEPIPETAEPEEPKAWKIVSNGTLPPLNSTEK